MEFANYAERVKRYLILIHIQNQKKTKSQL